MVPLPSIEDEIAEIENSHQSATEMMSPPCINAYNDNAKSGGGNCNKQSSMGSVDTHNSKDHADGDLLVSFPSSRPPGPNVSSSFTMGVENNGSRSSNNRNNGLSSSLTPGGKAKQRNSISLNPMAMRGALAGLADLVDSDDDDDDEGNGANANKQKAPLPPSQPANPKASGGPDHRPLVGGFAAAAYEAARVDYYKKQGLDVRGHQPKPPRAQYHLPRYP